MLLDDLGEGTITPTLGGIPTYDSIPPEAVSFARFATSPPDSDEPLLRELSAYDFLCPTCCPFVRDIRTGAYLPSWTETGLRPSPLHWSRQSEYPFVLRYADLEKHHQVIDIGAGWGVLQYALARRCAEVVSFDNDPDSLDKAKVTAKRLGCGNITHVVGDTRRLPFPDNHFDYVFCVSVLEHIEDDHARAIRELVRVLKPGGKLLLTMDVVVAGESSGNFYIDYDEAIGLLVGLGIHSIPDGAVSCELPTSEGKGSIVVIMVCYQKDC